MTLAERMQALLELVESHRAAQCAGILSAAGQQAAAARTQARADARARVREAYGDEQARAQARVAAARAELATRRRLHEQAQAAAWLALAWARLPPVLRSRWGDAAARRQWVDAALRDAQRVLAAGDWRIDHAPGWPDDERRSLAQRLQIDRRTTLEFAEHAGLGAGLRIVAGRNVVDATLAGLLADRESIGAGLLGELGATA